MAVSLMTPQCSASRSSGRAVHETLTYSCINRSLEDKNDLPPRPSGLVERTRSFEFTPARLLVRRVEDDRNPHCHA